MRIIDCYVRHDEADIVAKAAEEMELRCVASEAGETLRHVRVAISMGTPDDFLERIGKEIDFESDDETFYIVSEPLGIRPLDAEEAELREAERQAARDEIEAIATQGCAHDRTFIVLSVASAVIATGGLIVQNIPVVVGAMVIAPVFKPLVAVTTGITLGRIDFVWRGLLSVAITLGIAIVGGALITFATPFAGSNPSLELRSDLSLFALIVALAAGAAAGYTVIRNDRVTMIGIVVAASLVPAAAAVGVGIGALDGPLVAGSAATLLSNLVGITLAMLIVMRIEQLRAARGLDRANGQRLSNRTIWAGVGATIILAGVFATFFFLNYASERRLAAGQRVFKATEDYPEGVLAWTFDDARSLAFIYTDGEMDDAWRADLARRLGERGAGEIKTVIVPAATLTSPGP
jgi:uncharacterized hydrophobic protein (TIGR00341 family)